MLANRVRELTNTTGTGDLTLAGAFAGHIRFADVFTAGEVVTYVIEDGDNYEIGNGTFTLIGQIERTEVLETLVDGIYTGDNATPIPLSGNARVFCAATSQFLLSATEEADLIREATTDAGVTIDGVLIKDGGATFTNKVAVTGNIDADRALLNAGSAASPTHTFAGNLSTGAYAPAADQYAISTGGTQALIIDDSQNATFAGNAKFAGAVGIGKSPARPLDIEHSGQLFAEFKTTLVDGNAGQIFSNDAQSWTAGVAGNNSDSFMISTGTGLAPLNAVLTLGTDKSATFAGSVTFGGVGLFNDDLIADDLIRHSGDTDSLTISGGSSKFSGANIGLFGPNHSSKPGVTEIRYGASTVVTVDGPSQSAAFAGNVSTASGKRLRVGGTPRSDWISTHDVLEIGQSCAMMSNISGIKLLTGANWYFDGVYQYRDDGYAVQHFQDGSTGKHLFRVATSGTADNELNWITAFEIDNDGTASFSRDVTLTKADAVLNVGTNRGEIGIGVNAIIDDGTNMLFDAVRPLAVNNNARIVTPAATDNSFTLQRGVTEVMTLDGVFDGFTMNASQVARISTGGTTALTIDANQNATMTGRVGAGGASQSAWFEARGGGAGFEQYNGSDARVFSVGTTSNNGLLRVFDSTESVFFRVDASDSYVQVGDIDGGAPIGALRVKSDSNGSAIYIEEPSGGGENYQIGVTANGSLEFYNSASNTATMLLGDDDSVTFAGGVSVNSAAVDVLSLTRTETGGGVAILFANGDDEQARVWLDGSQTLRFDVGGTITTDTKLSIDTAGNATFTGQVIAPWNSGYKFDAGGAVIKAAGSGGGTVLIKSGDGAKPLQVDDYGGTTALLIDVDYSATFAGKLTVRALNDTWFDFSRDGSASGNYGVFRKVDGTSALGYLGGGAGAALSGDATEDDLVVRAEGDLYLASGGNNEALRLDTNQNAIFAGNVNLSTSPMSTFNTTYNAIQLGTAANIMAVDSGNGIYINDNAFIDSDLWKYESNAAASNYRQQNGVHTFRVAPSGPAGNTPNWTTALEIDNSGNSDFSGIVTFDRGGSSFSLKPGSLDHVYVSFFAETASPTVRSGFFGYGSAGTTTMTLKNERSGGSLALATAGGNGLTLGSDLSANFAGSVGIGATPSALFHIGGASGTAVTLMQRTNAHSPGFTLGEIRWEDSDDAVRSIIRSRAASSDADATELVFIVTNTSLSQTIPLVLKSDGATFADSVIASAFAGDAGGPTAPSFAPGNLNLGMYRSATDVLGFSVAGVEQFTLSVTEADFKDNDIVTTGRVGIGTAPSNSKLRVHSSVDNTSSWWLDSDAGVIIGNNNLSGDAILKLAEETARIVYGSGLSTDELVLSSRNAAGDTAKAVVIDANGALAAGANIVSTTNFRGGVGAAAVPTHSFSDHTDMGAYVHSADVYGIAVGGATQLTISESVASFSGELLLGGSGDKRSITTERTDTPTNGQGVGTWESYALNSAGERTRFARIITNANDTTDGAEDGYMRFSTMVGGTLINHFDLGPDGASFASDLTVSGSSSTRNITTERTDTIADGAGLGTWESYGLNDAASRIRFARIITLADDVAGGSEDGTMRFSTVVGGALVDHLDLGPDGAAFAGDVVGNVFNGRYFIRGVNTSDLSLSAGSAWNLGANLWAFGENHATRANDMELRAGATPWLSWDDSAGAATFAGDVNTSQVIGRYFTRGIGTSDVTMSGGSASGQGANIILRGESHVTEAGDILLRTGGTTRARWDESADEWNYQGKDLTNIGILSSERFLAGGLTAQDHYLHSFGGTLNSTGSNTVAAGLAVRPDVVGAAGDTSWLSHAVMGAGVGGAVTTQGESETISLVSTLYLSEPNITVGTGDTINNAATLYIQNVPSEATNNYAILVAEGASKFGGDLDVSGNDIIGVDNLRGDLTTQSLIIGADPTLAEGGELILYPGSHPTAAGDILLRADGSIRLQWDESADEWNFQNKRIAEVGDVELGSNGYVYRDVDTGGTFISGGTSVADGGNIQLYAESHPTNASDIGLRSGATTALYYDSSASKWNFSGTNITGMNVITRGLTDDNLYLSGGTTSSLGGNIILRGQSNGSSANDIVFRAGAVVKLLWDNNESEWNFRNTDVVGIGDLVADSSITVSGYLLATGGTSGQFRIANSGASTAGQWWLQVRDNADFQIRHDTNGREPIEIKADTGRVNVNNGLKASGDILLGGLPTYDSEALADAAGLSTDQLYKTSTGELRIKL